MFVDFGVVSTRLLIGIQINNWNEQRADCAKNALLHKVRPEYITRIQAMVSALTFLAKKFQMETHKLTYSVFPPLTFSISPVIHAASSDAKNVTAFATSDTEPIHPSGVFFTLDSWYLSSPTSK